MNDILELLKHECGFQLASWMRLREYFCFVIASYWNAINRAKEFLARFPRQNLISEFLIAEIWQRQLHEKFQGFQMLWIPILLDEASFRNFPKSCGFNIHFKAGFLSSKCYNKIRDRMSLNSNVDIKLVAFIQSLSLFSNKQETNFPKSARVKNADDFLSLWAETTSCFPRWFQSSTSNILVIVKIFYAFLKLLWLNNLLWNFWRVLSSSERAIRTWFVVLLDASLYGLEASAKEIKSLFRQSKFKMNWESSSTFFVYRLCLLQPSWSSFHPTQKILK